MLQICLNMPDQCLNMPRYTLICQNKNRSKYANVLNTPDAGAYSIYPSIFRTLIYSGGPIQNLRHIRNTVKDLGLSYSEFCVTVKHSELEAHSELCRVSTMERLIQNPETDIVRNG